MKQLVCMLIDIQFNKVLLKKGDIIEVEPHESIPETFHVYFGDGRTETDLLWNRKPIFEEVIDQVA